MSTRVVLNRSALEDLTRSADMQRGLQTVGDQVAQRAASDAPKSTGAGAASIHCEVTTEGGEAVARVSWDAAHFYMYFHEVGTSRMSARPFLRPALDGTYNL